MTDRLLIEEDVDTLDEWDIFNEKTLYDVAEAFNQLAKKYEDETQGKIVKCKVEPYGYDGGWELKIVTYALESDYAYQSRMVALDRANKAKEDKDRVLYEELKKRFENEDQSAIKNNEVK